MNKKIEKIKCRIRKVKEKLDARSGTNPRRANLKLRYDALVAQLKGAIREEIKDLPILEKEQQFKTDVSFLPEEHYVETDIVLE